ncbi:serine/threonine-protein kinase [Catellatospora sp. NPDC049609]|uniref:serine/threonine-protein kinase n=1 Tax=Catellatospora sp. NPDC049609 TaxID=3155505 RepID=UPI0034286F60
MLDPGMTLGGRYELVDLIARGGMGEVWRADDLVLGRRVAVKALLPNLAADPGFAARFRAEARAMAALSHPGIVEIYDYGHADEVAYLVMQFVEGESLSSLIGRDGALAPGPAMRLLAQAADAIHAAHVRGIVHRDVKPSNLLLRPDGRLALTDFGIARIVAADRLTAADEILGTASYLAPEQVTGDPVGPATDVYALGVVAYELVTGDRPFTGDTPLAVALQHVNDDPPELPPGVPAPVRALIVRALAKEPDHRWPTAAALARAARAAAHAPAEPLSATGRSGGGATVPGTSSDEARITSAHGRTPAPPGGTESGPRGTKEVPPAGSRALARAGLAGTRRRGALAGAAAVLVLAAVAGYALTSGTDQDPPAAGSDRPTPTATAAATDAPATGAAAPSATRAPRATPTASGRAGTPRPSSTAAANPAATSPAAPASPAASTRKVPGMYGWREVEVTAELKRLGLIGRITYRATPDQCYAIEQTPAGGTVVAPGTTVDVVIATATDICKQV